MFGGEYPRRIGENTPHSEGIPRWDLSIRGGHRSLIDERFLYLLLESSKNKYEDDWFGKWREWVRYPNENIAVAPLNIEESSNWPTFIQVRCALMAPTLLQFMVHNICKFYAVSLSLFINTSTWLKTRVYVYQAHAEAHPSSLHGDPQQEPDKIPGAYDNANTPPPMSLGFRTIGQR